MNPYIDSEGYINIESPNHTYAILGEPTEGTIIKRYKVNTQTGLFEEVTE